MKNKVCMFLLLFFVAIVNINADEVKNYDVVKIVSSPSCNDSDKQAWFSEYVSEIQELNPGMSASDAISNATDTWNESCSETTSSTELATISDEDLDCSELLGSSLLAVLKLAISALRIGGAIIVIIQMSLALIPAVSKGDDAAIKKATNKCVSLAVVLLLIGVFPTIIRVIAEICGFDPSCL